jgi:sulfur-carrier protein adenylyltransferase/sulfurtransferase
MKWSGKTGILAIKPMLNKEELQRYSRHISLAEVGLAGQEKLKQASVLVIGAGGLGCPCLQYLSAAGVGRLGIVDFDTVDVSNLQRQILYTTEDLGKQKSVAAATRLQQSNPHTHITSYTEPLDEYNALEIIKAYDIIVDGSDNFSTRYLVSDACVLLNKPLVFGSIFKFDGQVAVLNHNTSEGKRGPTYRCLFPEPPAAGEMPSCSETGVLGVLPGIIGSMQANEVLKLILTIGEPLSGKLYTFDALSMQSSVFHVEANPINHTITTLGHYAFNCDVPEHDTDSIDVHTLNKILQKPTEPFLLLDVREPHEYEICRLDGALFMPMNTVPQHLHDLPQHQKIIVYCHHGMRSASVVDYLRNHGIKHTYNLDGGIHAWAKEIDLEMNTY